MTLLICSEFEKGYIVLIKIPKSLGAQHSTAALRGVFLPCGSEDLRYVDCLE